MPVFRTWHGASADQQRHRTHLTQSGQHCHAGAWQANRSNQELRMAVAADLLTAGAASVAALLSGVNLYVSGRRAEHRWNRDALIEAFVTFVGASFSLNAACTAGGRLGRNDQDSRKYALQAIDAHDTETHTLTRLRLLASSVLVAEAEALHGAEHRLIEVSFSDDPAEQAERQARRTTVRKARERLVKAARADLHLRDAAPITHLHSDTGWEAFTAWVRE
jgi:hypothetical protein